MATVSTPSSRQARMTRRAISPRLATRMRLYMLWLLPRVDLEQWLAKFHRLAVFDQAGHDLAGHLRRDLVEDLHGLDDADRALRADVISHLHERRRLRIRAGVERA